MSKKKIVERLKEVSAGNYKSAFYTEMAMKLMSDSEVLSTIELEKEILHELTSTCIKLGRIQQKFITHTVPGTKTGEMLVELSDKKLFYTYILTGDY